MEEWITMKIYNFILYIIYYWKGGETMMAMFFAQRIILGKITFDRVPKVLQPKVKEILIESGLEELIEGK